MVRHSVFDYFKVLIHWRKFIIRNIIIVTILAIIISFLLEKKYTATATILPPSPEQDAMFSLMFGLSGSSGSGMSSLARLGGIVPGFSTPSDLYAAIMKSSRIKSVIIKKYDLKKEFQVKMMTDASKMLSEITKIEVSPEGLISVSVTYKDKQLATDIANSYIEELDKFNNETAMTTGKKYRIFVEKRLRETEDSLAKAETSLQEFQEKHRTVSLEIEIQSAIETVAKLKGEIMLREVQKGALGSAGSSNPYVQNIEQELRELKRQLAKIEFGTKDTTKKEFGAGFAIPFMQLPTLSLEYARLLRDVKIQEVIFELLTQQYEQAKIMEMKDTPTVQFLDQAGVPEKKSSPKRALITVFAFVLSIIASIILVFILEYISDFRINPAKHDFAVKTVGILTKDFRDLSNVVKNIAKFGRH